MMAITGVLQNMSALPFRDTITFDAARGAIFVNGKQLTPEQATLLRTSANAAQDSFALKLVHEQVRFKAVKMGVHEGLNPDMIMFAKAALWYAEEENKLLSTLASE